MIEPEAPAVGVTEPGASAVHTARAVRVGVGRLRRRLREHYDHEQLTASQTAVLGRLDRDGPASASELATAEGVRPQSMAMSVSALVARELVDRAPDPRDARRLVISLNDAGRTFIATSRAAGEGWLAAAISERLTEAEHRTLREAMALLERVASPSERTP